MRNIKGVGPARGRVILQRGRAWRLFLFLRKDWGTIRESIGRRGKLVRFMTPGARQRFIDP